MEKLVTNMSVDVIAPGDAKPSADKALTIKLKHISSILFCGYQLIRIILFTSKRLTRYSARSRGTSPFFK